MSLQTLIKTKIAHKGIEATAKLLGYSASSPKFKLRVQQLIESPYLGLDQSHYDFKYDSSTFVKKLSEALDIPEHLYSTVIDETHKALALENEKMTHFFLETNFKRKNQPVFVLCAVQSNRFLSVDKDISNLPLNDQLEKLSCLIQRHNKESPSLQIWGTIVSYVYFYTDDTILIFSTSGELLESRPSYEYSRGTLSLK